MQIRYILNKLWRRQGGPVDNLLHLSNSIGTSVVGNKLVHVSKLAR